MAEYNDYIANYNYNNIGNETKFTPSANIMIPTIYSNRLSDYEIMNKILYYVKIFVDDLSKLLPNNIALQNQFAQLKEYIDDFTEFFTNNSVTKEEAANIIKTYLGNKVEKVQFTYETNYLFSSSDKNETYNKTLTTDFPVDEEIVILNGGWYSKYDPVAFASGTNYLVPLNTRWYIPSSQTGENKKLTVKRSAIPSTVGAGQFTQKTRVIAIR